VKGFVWDLQVKSINRRTYFIISNNSGDDFGYHGIVFYQTVSNTCFHF